MQLSHRIIRGDICAAAAAVLATPVPAAAEEPDWQYDIGMFAFSEVDRVTGIEFMYGGFKEYGPEDLLRWNWSVDILIGASHNGASPTDVAQTFARPSGKSAVRIPAGEHAFDNIFQDNRFDLAFTRSKPISDDWGIDFGGGLSYEYDYKALDGNVAFRRDFNEKNSTVLFGYSTEFAVVDPEGGVPIPFDSPLDAGIEPVRLKLDDDKSVHDAVFGLTQIVNRRFITQWNYSFRFAEGYLTDPYKVLSVVDPADRGRTDDYVYELRPRYKRAHLAYHESRYRFDESILRFSYRYSTDTWGQRSHTVTGAYRWLQAGGRYWEINSRFYDQGGVDFYRHSLRLGESPQFATADLRHAPFNAVTLGLKRGVRHADGSGWSVRVEYYTQFGEERPDDAVGVQRDYDLFPQLHMFKILYQIHLR